MQKIRSDDQLTKEKILTSLEQSIVLSSSSSASFSSVRRQRFRNVLAPEYASLVNYDSETPSKFLFGDNIADEVEKRSKEQRIIKKISKNSFHQSSHPMPNNQSRAFRSGSNTFNQSTYKHQVHPKRRVVLKKINNQDSKTKIQIKGQILKPPNRSNSFIFKKLGEDNSKQISFRHCKRLQDSFCSETNPDLCLSQFQLGTSPLGNPRRLAQKTCLGGRDLTFESCPGAGIRQGPGFCGK